MRGADGKGAFGPDMAELSSWVVADAGLYGRGHSVVAGAGLGGADEECERELEEEEEQEAERERQVGGLGGLVRGQSCTRMGLASRRLSSDPVLFCLAHAPHLVDP